MVGGRENPDRLGESVGAHDQAGQRLQAVHSKGPQSMPGSHGERLVMQVGRAIWIGGGGQVRLLLQRLGQNGGHVQPAGEADGLVEHASGLFEPIELSQSRTEPGHRLRREVGHPSLGVCSYESLEAARYAMGDTLRLAERVGLIEMQPLRDLSSTGYILANVGMEYVVLQPNETADPFTVTLAPGTYAVEWFSIEPRETLLGGEVTIECLDTVSFSPPFATAGPVVLYLLRV
jgi:hypothetical protein